MTKQLTMAWMLLVAIFAATSVADDAPKNFGLVPAGAAKIHPGWDEPEFPKHAVCFKTPEEIKKLYQAALRNPRANPVTAHEKPTDGSLRMVGTAHSFCAAAYRQLPTLARQAGHKQQQEVLVNASGGDSGSSRTKWEQENGIYRFSKPEPKLMASIANAEWDVMLLSPYYNDRPRFYEGWIDFCLKHNPHMKFYLMDAWPQIGQFAEQPKSDDAFTVEVLEEMRRRKTETNIKLVSSLNKKYPHKVFVVPTCNAFTLAAQHQVTAGIPGFEGVHHLTCRKDKEQCIWKDRIGHPSRAMISLEVYVYYATVFGRNPELIPHDDRQNTNDARDKLFRKLAWQAVLSHPLSGVKDENKNGIADNREGEQ